MRCDIASGATEVVKVLVALAVVERRDSASRSSRLPLMSNNFAAVLSAAHQLVPDHAQGACVWSTVHGSHRGAFALS
jgi:hypothetical protein